VVICCARFPQGDFLNPAILAAHYFDGIHTNVLFDSVVIIALYLDAGSAQLGTVWTLFKLYKAKLF